MSDLSFPASFSPEQVKVIKKMGQSLITLPIKVDIGGTESITAAQFRENFSLVPGTDVQAQNAHLQQISSLGDAEEKSLYFYDQSAGSYDFLQVGDNLSFDGTTLNAASATTGVTEIQTGAGLTGGPINSTGTVSLAYGVPINYYFQAKTDTFTTTSSSFVTITGLSQTFSKINIETGIFGIVTLNLATQDPSTVSQGLIQIQRNGSPIFYGDLTGSLTTPTTAFCSSYNFYTNCASFCFFDAAEGITNLTYDILVAMPTSQTFYLNRTSQDVDVNSTPRMSSSSFYMEMAGG